MSFVFFHAFFYVIAQITGFEIVTDMSNRDFGPTVEWEPTL